RTTAAVRGAFELEEPLTIEAKGKPDGVVSRRLVRALSLMRPRGVGGRRQASVGRDHELDELRAAYEGVVRDEAPGLVTIVGDAELLKLLDSRVAQLDGLLLMLATGRPELLERRPAWSKHAVVLDALPAAVAADLLDELLGVELPPSVRNVIVVRAEGNPFFV